MDTPLALSPEITIQSSPSTAAAVSGALSWLAADLPLVHCVLVGPHGSGRTHLVDALNGIPSVRGVFALSPADDDWIATLTACEPDSFVLVDNLDGYDGKFHKTLFRSAVDHRLRLFATSRGFEGRLVRLWESMLGHPILLRLEPLQARADDVREFLRRWMAAQSHPVADEHLTETVELAMSLRLPNNFADLVSLLQRLSAQGYDFSGRPRAPAWVDAYHNLLDSAPASSVILVEGETDARYFRWVAEMALGKRDSDLSIDACGSAAKVAERSVACRNEGRRAVALFDFDRLGRKYYEDLREWGHPCLIIAPSLDPLEHQAPDHVLQVVEIEDLLPIAAVECFYAEAQKRPEVEIALPSLGLKRLVPSAQDKLDLARWVTTKRSQSDGERILKVYNELRTKLSLAPLAFPTAT